MQLPLQRRPHLDVAAETHDEQDRRSFAADRHPQEVPVDPDEGLYRVRSQQVDVAARGRLERRVGGVAGVLAGGDACRRSGRSSQSCHGVHQDPGAWAARFAPLGRGGEAASSE